MSAPVLGTDRTLNRAFEVHLGTAFRKQLRFTPYPAQEAILDCTARYQIFAGGRRVGKSRTGGHKLIPSAFTAFEEVRRMEDEGWRREYWIVGPEYSDAEKEFRVLWDGLKRLGVTFDRPGSYNNPITGDMHIGLWGGLFQVHAKSAKYPETLVGEGLSGIVLSEAAKIKERVWTKYLSPTLADFSGWMYAGSTPEGRNWFYRAWESGQDPMKPDWRSWRLPSWANPYVYSRPGTSIKAIRTFQNQRRKKGRPPEGFSTWNEWGDSLDIDPEIMAMAINASDETFNQEVGAEFNEFVGRVFKDFDEEIHVGSFRLDREWTTYACVDYGFTNPFAWLLLQVDPHRERIVVLDEYFERGRTTGEAGREILARGLAPDSLVTFYPDPAEPDRTLELEGLLKRRGMGGTGGLIEDRLEWIRRKLHPDAKVSHLDPEADDWVPQLMIDRRCVNTIREFGAYRYPATFEEAQARDREAPELPLKKDDHTIEALGRFMIGFFGSPWAAVTSPVRQSRARMRRR
jgi:hypothetical protein